MPGKSAWPYAAMAAGERILLAPEAGLHQAAGILAGAAGHVTPGYCHG
jgi:hypothetical protein